MDNIPVYRISKRHKNPKKLTASGFYIKKAFENLTNCLLENQTRQVMFWVSDLIASGLITELWLYIIDFYSMYTHLYYPNFILYVYEKYNDYLLIRKNTRYVELKNNIKLREYFYRIFYIYSTLHKRFIVDTFKQPDLFKSFRVLHDKHKHLEPTDEILLNNISETDAGDIISFINHKSKDQIENALHQLRLNFQEFIDCYKDSNDQTKYMVYHWLSFLLEKGAERFQLYQTGDYIHLKHCRNENKYSYFIWIIWNILLEHSQKTPQRDEIRALYTLYDKYKNNQSTSAYFLIISAFAICLEKMDKKKIYIDEGKYVDNKIYFYKCFGFIEEALVNNTNRRDG